MISWQDIDEAHHALEGMVKHTPLLRSRTFSQMVGCNLHLKLENLQTAGSFKIRGALNCIRLLTPEQRTRGVVCASAGNHAQGVAFAARTLGVSSTVFIPVFAPPSKILATRGYGAEVVLQGATYDEAFQAASTRATEAGHTLVHAFDDAAVIAGQGTVGVELFDDLPDVDVVLVPIGGGGLAAGIAVALRHLRPQVRIIGVEAEGAAAMQMSLEAGDIVPALSIGTICDGIAVKTPGRIAFALLQEHLEEIVTVSDDETAQALFLLGQRAKLIAEPAGAVALAAMLSGKVSIANKNVVAIVSGGNVDLALLGQIVERGLLRSGLRVKIAVELLDRPGSLNSLLELLTSLRANIHTIEHDRQALSVPLGHVRVTVTFRTLGAEQLPAVEEALRQRGLRYEVLC